MNLFDQLTREALRNTPELGLLRPVVEKELLHHDILREMGDSGVLQGLVFMGGTCLRTCYGSLRLSEDLIKAGDPTPGPGTGSETTHGLPRRTQTLFTSRPG